ncbi:MAG: Uma2 family endonuclease, partial [Planctomycetes bacterium]|nr:Uma2 family endonuclease [Planctomycetota bacterium]
MATDVADAVDAATLLVPSLEDDRLYEIVNGERQELEPMSAFAIRLASRLLFYLELFNETAGRGITVTEMLFVLQHVPRLERRPDVAFVSFDRWTSPSVPHENAWDVVPNLAAEIVPRALGDAPADG